MTMTETKEAEQVVTAPVATEPVTKKSAIEQWAERRAPRQPRGEYGRQRRCPGCGDRISRRGRGDQRADAGTRFRDNPSRRGCDRRRRCRRRRLQFT